VIIPLPASAPRRLELPGMAVKQLCVITLYILVAGLCGGMGFHLILANNFWSGMTLVAPGIYVASRLARMLMEQRNA
jgi:hypothetical protein